MDVLGMSGVSFEVGDVKVAGEPWPKKTLID